MVTRTSLFGKFITHNAGRQLGEGFPRESNAIIEYLIDKYDKEHKISIPENDDQKYIQTQWLFFQASGQGPYFGQASWFLFYHEEKVPSAIDRYRKEVRRVLGVLESVLSKQDWLVGGRPTVADLSFILYVPSDT